MKSKESKQSVRIKAFEEVIEICERESLIEHNLFRNHEGIEHAIRSAMADHIQHILEKLIEKETL